MKKVIGIVGYAGTGKDTLAELLINYADSIGETAQRFSFADILKEELRPLLISHGIDPVSCSRQDKEKIRNLLVEYGLFLRNNTEGRYLVEMVQKQIEQSTCKYAIVTDIRYQQYEHDEYYWLMEEMKGIAIILNRYDLVHAKIDTDNKKMVECNDGQSLMQKFVEAANNVEHFNRERIQQYITKHPEQKPIFLSWASFEGDDYNKWKTGIGKWFEKYIRF